MSQLECSFPTTAFSKDSNAPAAILAVDNPENLTAEQAKEKANGHFKERKYNEAIKYYTLSLELEPNTPACLSNRAFAYIKTEMYGLAIADADEALRLDPSFLKGYYRRGTANMALCKYREARKDFKLVAKKAPGDKDAKAKLNEVEKIIRRLEFEKAIETDAEEKHTISHEAVDAIIVESYYDGLPLHGPVGKEFIQDMIFRFKAQKKIHKKYAFQILLQVKELFQKYPPLKRINLKKDEIITVCGDVHGQFYDLINLFERAGYPSEKHFFLFNGDMVDRGSFSIECILLLFAYKLLYPNSFYLARGNHETREMNRMYGFEGEAKTKFSDTMFKLFSECFNALPLVHLINEKIFVVHGGLPKPANTTLEDIEKIDRFGQPGSEGLMCDLLWADPTFKPGYSPSKRGVSHQFGPDITETFCQTNGLDMIIRSHEVQQGGYDVTHNGKCITVFSAPNYCDQIGNKGAFIHISSDLRLTYETFNAVPHPNVKPMQYASQFSQFGF